MTPDPARQRPAARSGLLAFVERLGNRLPDPTFMFIGATVLVIAVSAVGAAAGWSVQPVRPFVTAAGSVALQNAGDPIGPLSLASSDGVYWFLTSLVSNFVKFPPLGVILVCMLGIGVAEHTGLFAAAMRRFGSMVPGWALTPTVLMISFLSHVGADSGFIVLPPLAAGLYAACGRSPVVGAALAYAGAAGGFSANLVISPSDALMAPLTQRGANILDPAYHVQVACNFYFLAVSAVVLTLVGWLVTSAVVEPSAARTDEVGESRGSADIAALSPIERRGLRVAAAWFLASLGVVVALALVPGAPLYGSVPQGSASSGARWSSAIVPIIFFVFLIPGLAYGLTTGSIRRLAHVSEAFTRAMVSMAPIIAMYFFAAQFIECFRYSHLDVMLAHAGGKALAASGLPRPALLVGLIVVVMTINLLIPSMTAKWTALSTVVVPMMMMSGIAPELTQAAYRVGDSVTHPITPFNPYIIIVLAVVQRYRRDAGIGTIISLTLPYTIAFFIAWTLLLLAWIAIGLPLGTAGALWYTPGHG